ncbi:MAG: TIGR00269 family protein [Nanoarchaeota archaeon]
MKCINCQKNPVIKLTNSNISLCKNHFNRYFERKVRKTIRIYKMIDKEDFIGVAVSGGKDSMSLLYILNKIFKPTKVKIIAIAIDEGIKGYRDPNFKFVKEFCKKYDIELHTTSFKKETGKTLDQMTKKTDIIPCTICGVFRRKLLNETALELGIKKLATGHNLDDESQSILMNQLRKNVRASAILGPVTGIVDDPKFIRRIKPFYFLTEKEITTFAFLNKLLDKYIECPNAKLGYRSQVRDWLNGFEKQFPGTKHNIVSSFLTTLPSIKETFKSKTINSCKKCGSATSQEICKACILLEEIR